LTVFWTEGRTSTFNYHTT